MLKRRIIPCLDIKDGQTVKGVKFEDLRFAGDPVELAKKYVSDGADELVFLDITATLEGRKTLVKLVEELSREIDIPFTIGGGISSVEDVEILLRAGADKVSVNSAAVRRPELISELAARFGSQCIVLAVDTRKTPVGDVVCINGGKVETQTETLEWIQLATELGAGEILLTSMDFDGTKSGFDLRMLKKVTDITPLPIIASGGAGSMSHFNELFSETKVTGALAASIFHFNEINIADLKYNLKINKIPIR